MMLFLEKFRRVFQNKRMLLGHVKVDTYRVLQKVNDMTLSKAEHFSVFVGTLVSKFAIK